MLTFGQNRSTGEFVPIRDVGSGLSSVLQCFQCGSRLIAKKGLITSHHFAHLVESNCNGETTYHHLAKEILKEQKRLLLSRPGKPSKRYVNFEEAHLEYRHQGFVIDCLMITSSGKKLAVEIKVTHGVDHKKRMMFRKESLAVIEIDLSHLSDMTSEPTKESMTTEICDSTKYIKWLFNKKWDAEIQPYLRRLQEKVKERKAPKRSKSYIYPPKPWARRRNSKDRMSKEYKLRNQKPRKYICSHEHLQRTDKCMNRCPDCQVLVLTNQNHKWKNLTDRRRHMDLIKCSVCGQEFEVFTTRPIDTQIYDLMRFGLSVEEAHKITRDRK